VFVYANTNTLLDPLDDCHVARHLFSLRGEMESNSTDPTDRSVLQTLAVAIDNKEGIPAFRPGRNPTTSTLTTLWYLA
jgi:hypothetical protein